MLTDGAGNLFFGNPGSSQWLNGTSGTISYSSGSIGINTTTPLALLSIVGSSTSPTSLFNVAASTGASLFNIASNGNVTVGNTLLNAKCDGVTDMTAALNAQLSALYTAGGGSLVLSGICVVMGQLVISNDGNTGNPKQPAIRITGNGASANGYWGALSSSASGLDLQYNAAVAKIDTRGAGVLEIDHLLLKDSGSDCATFIQTTNTTLKIHDDAFSGTASSASACNDAIVLEGTTNTISNGSNAAFQGYGTVIYANFFDKIRRLAYLRTYANAIVIRDNTISTSSGTNLANGAAIEVLGDACSGGSQYDAGNVIENNLFETTYYPYPIKLACAAQHYIAGNGMYDPGSATIAFLRFESTAGNNTVIHGWLDNRKPAISDASTQGQTVINSGLVAPSVMPLLDLPSGQPVIGRGQVSPAGPTWIDSAGDQWLVAATALNWRLDYTPVSGAQTTVAQFRYGTGTSQLIFYGTSSNYVDSGPAINVPLKFRASEIWLEAPQYNSIFGNAPQFNTQTTGAVTTNLGTNSPAVAATPNTWLTIKLSDGTTGYVPVWK
jgi:hypothetical protein